MLCSCPTPLSTVNGETRVWVGGEAMMGPQRGGMEAIGIKGSWARGERGGCSMGWIRGGMRRIAGEATRMTCKSGM